MPAPLADVTARDHERADQGCGDGVEASQGEGDCRSEQRARILPADRRRGRTGQEPADVAEPGDVADQQALDEQEPRVRWEVEDEVGFTRWNGMCTAGAKS